jgi:uncharacterized protein YndB with AHSA1/START domain
MSENLVAKADVVINAPVSEVWDALVNPDKIRRYMFGANVLSDWKVGSPIVWKGEWKGKPFEDEGRVLEVEQGTLLRYSHFSPRSGAPDPAVERPENYHTVTIRLEGQDGAVHVDLAQDNNPTEKVRDESRHNWSIMLDGLKQTVEGRAPARG